MVGAWDDRVEGWFNLVSNGGLSLSTWDLAAERPDSRLLHRSCPWGGHLVRLDLRNIPVMGAPENASNVLVRPEVRSHYCGVLEKGVYRDVWSSEILKTFNPGDALIEQFYTMPALRLPALLFGDFSVLESLYGPSSRGFLGRQRLRRDFPEQGHSTYIFEDRFGRAQEYLLTTQREDQSQNIFHCVCIFSTPEDKWYDWFSPFFFLVMEEAYRVVRGYLNRPGIQELRQADEKFYITLALRNFNRGPPLLPSDEHDESVIIQDGHDRGLSCWIPFEQKKFCFAEYLRQFLDRLGHGLVPIYDNLDGKTLVPYQCVMVRESWMELRREVLAALKLQKMAYRFRHGGTTAPSLVEDVCPRPTPKSATSPSYGCGDGLCDQPFMPKVVVRKTFLELEDDVPYSQLLENLPANLSLKRSKSASGDILNLSVQHCP